MSSKNSLGKYFVCMMFLTLIMACNMQNNLATKENQEINVEKFLLTIRNGNPPKIGKVVPQLQYSDKSPRDVYNKMHDWMFSTFPHVRKEPTRISVPTSIAMWLEEDLEVAHKDAFMPTPGSREFTHLHLDGSIHTVVAKNVENEIIAKNWGVRHMYYDEGVKEMLVYAPRNEDEIEILKKIITKSYEYATGLVFKE